MNMDKRKRSCNYTPREKEVLLSLVGKYITIIENKKTNSIFNKKKKQYWEHIAKEFNALQTSGMRSGTQLKTCYEQMKKMAKQRQAEDKVGFYCRSVIYHITYIFLFRWKCLRQVEEYTLQN